MSFQEHALKMYTRAINSDPSAERYLNRAQVYANMKNFDEAMKDIELALTLEPENQRAKSLKTEVEDDIANKH